MLTGCKEEEEGVSDVHALCWAGPRDPTAAPGASLPVTAYVPTDGFASQIQASSFAGLLPHLQRMVRQCKPQTSKSESMCRKKLLVHGPPVSRETYCLYSHPQSQP